MTQSHASTTTSGDPTVDVRTDAVDLYGPVTGDLPLVETMLTDLQRVEFPWLRRMLESVLGGGGKRMRPARSPPYSSLRVLLSGERN